MASEVTGIRVQGFTAHDSGNNTAILPVKVGGVATAALQTAVTEGDISQLSLDLSGRLRTISEGTVADAAVAGTAELPVRMGAVAEATPAGTGIANGDKAHLITDLYRRLRVFAEGAAASGAALVGNPIPTGAKANAADQADVDENDVVTLSATLAGRLRVQAAGVAAHDAAASGNPVLVGAKATSLEPANVDVNDVAVLSADLGGRLRVNLGACADDAQDSQPMNPAKVGGRCVDNSAPENLDTANAGDVVHFITDLTRHLLVNVSGNQRDDAVADATCPVRVAGVAEDDAYSATGVADADVAQLTTDLKRRLRVIVATEAYNASWIDSDVVQADAYYPAEAGWDMNVYKDLTITGKVTTGADNTSVLTFQVTNDEDATPANRDWQTIFVKDNIIDENVNQFATGAGATSNIAVSLNGLGFRYVRAYYNTTVGTTNKDTVILKARSEG